MTGVDTYGVLVDRKLVMWSHINVMWVKNGSVESYQ